MQTVSTADGAVLCISKSEEERGSRAPFFVAYRSMDEDESKSHGEWERYGWFCGHCESIDNAMDSMGRIRCNQCGNFRKPTVWDAAHE